MRIGRLLIVPFVLILAGCFQGQRTFKVNADGSGTIVDTVKLGEQAKGMLSGLEEMDKSSPAEKAAKKKAKQVEQAATMGEGVTFVSQVTGKDGSDVTTWSFKDITKVKVSAMPSPDESATNKAEPLVFKLTKGASGNSVLTIVSPPDKPADPSAPAKPKKKPEELQQEITMMKGMMAGLKIKSVVEVNGKLVKSSSPHAVGSAVTLMEMDFDALDMPALQKLSEGAPGGGPPTPAQMKGIKGVKVSDPEVSIEFTGGK